jgi:hypothetical protein
MRRIRLYVFALGFIALLSFCMWVGDRGDSSRKLPNMPTKSLPAGAPKNQQDCEQNGGDWGPQGLNQTLMCDMPAADAGKQCTNSDQCEGLCLAPPGVDLRTGTDGFGQCSPRQINFGCALRIEDRKIWSICTD